MNLTMIFPFVAILCNILALETNQMMPKYTRCDLLFTGYRFFCFPLAFLLTVCYNKMNRIMTISMYFLFKRWSNTTDMK